MASSLLCGRLCIIIAVIILLFLPLTFAVNNKNNASAQSQSSSDVYDAWDHYRDAMNAWQQCQGQISYCGPAPRPPQPLQPLDCKQLNTCPTNPSRPPQIYDWNEEARQFCKDFRSAFYIAACSIIAERTKSLGAGIGCGWLGYIRAESCQKEHPPDLHYDPPPPPPPPEPIDYCDQPRYGCVRGW